MPVPTYSEARTIVLREVKAHRATPEIEVVPLDSSLGRVLAADAPADRDYPPFDRATRDGFALKSTDIPGRLRIVGESRAGQSFDGEIHTGEAIEIMTGAPAPAGADAVVMIEHCSINADGTVSTDRSEAAGTNIAPKGCESRAGDIILRRGTRIDYPAIGWLATTGRTQVEVYRRPRVAILATGDEIVPVDETPAAHQIRNSNAHTLAAQVQRAGGDPILLPIARDEKEDTIRLIREGLNADLLLLSGGVSAGKFDFVEPALMAFDAHFYFDRVLIQPGQPLVFGRAHNKFFFGLPGNPGSTMVTFELFARAAIDLLSGVSDVVLPLALAKLTRPFRHKPGLTRFLPAHLSCGEVTPVDWQGSADIPSYCRANAYLVADPNQPEYAAGDTISVLIQ